MTSSETAWDVAPLEKVAQIQTGGTPPRKELKFFGGTVPWIKPSQLGSLVPLQNSPETLSTEGALQVGTVPAGSVLLCCIGTIGKLGVAGCEVATNQQINSVTFDPSKVDPRFGAYYLSTQTEWLKENSSSTTISIINKGRLSKLPVMIPPLHIQKSISNVLDQVLSSLKSPCERLATIADLLKKFRQSVLAAACSGQLTSDWRTSVNPVESGLELLGRLTKTINKTPTVFQSNDIPESWVECTMDSILPKGDIFDGPFGSSLKSSDYTESGVRVIRLENIGVLEFRADKHTYISELKHEVLKRHSVFEGDIIFSSFISDELRVCVLPSIGRAIAKADCFCLRPFKELNRQYIALQLSSQFTHDELIECVHGATRPRVNTGQLRSIRFRLAPMAEQVEIVRRVESLFAIADSIESRLAEATAQVERTTQAILAKAFRGELTGESYVL